VAIGLFTFKDRELRTLRLRSWQGRVVLGDRVVRMWYEIGRRAVLFTCLAPGIRVVLGVAVRMTPYDTEVRRDGFGNGDNAGGQGWCFIIRESFLSATVQADGCCFVVT